MRILAFDTSSLRLSVALMVNGKPKFLGNSSDFEHFVPTNRGSSSLLVPAIEHGLTTVGWKASDLDLIALTIGPGSFTGLRVGVVTAKSLAYVNGTPIVGVNTLEVLATQAFDEYSSFNKVIAVTNAQRQQLFSSLFERQSTGMATLIGKTEIQSRQDWMAQLRQDDFVTGPGLQPIVGELESQHADVEIASNVHWVVNPVRLGQIAEACFNAGGANDLWSLEPEYFRPSSAEEKANLGIKD